MSKSLRAAVDTVLANVSITGNSRQCCLMRMPNNAHNKIPRKLHHVLTRNNTSYHYHQLLASKQQPVRKRTTTITTITTTITTAPPASIYNTQQTFRMSSSSNSDSRPRSPIRGLPLHQPYFTFRDDAWKPVEAASSSSPSSSPGAREQESSTTRLPAEVVFAVLSWNIDFQREFAEPRMKAALNHVYHTLQHRSTVPSIIMFEEMEECDLTTIQEQGWVREGYHLTDLTREFWESPGHYGTCMLVPKTLKIKAVFRVHYEITSMQRDALFVDIALPENKTLRVCATHLESLRARVPKRPAQLATAARYLHEADVGIIAGDFNAIEPFDMTLHVENNLKDAYLERGGQEDEEAGMTWGQMAFTFSRKQYGLCRMDKVLFCGRQRVELLDFATFGSDVQVEDEADRKAMMDELGTMLEKPWVTDHLGVRADFRIILSG